MSITQIAAILPVYNGEEHLSEAIASVCAQDTDDWTLYVVDDGSHDATPDILRSWQQRYPDKIKLYRMDVNSGAAAACNAGLDRAGGHPYIVIVNADDVQVSSRFSRLLREIKRTRADIVMHDCEIIDGSGARTGRTKGFEGNITPRNVLAEQLRRNHFWSGLVICRNTPDLRFDPHITISEDYDLFTRLFYKGATFSYLDERLLLYRVHDRNISLSYQRSDDIFVKMFNKYDITDLENKIRKAYDEPGEVYLSLAHVCMYRRERESALRYLERGVEVSGRRDQCLSSLMFMKGYLLYLDYQLSISLAAFAEGLSAADTVNPAFYNNLGALIYLVHRDADEAQSLIRKAVEIEELYSDARHNLESIEKGGQLPLRITPRLLRTHIYRSLPV